MASYEHTFPLLFTLSQLINNPLYLLIRISRISQQIKISQITSLSIHHYHLQIPPLYSLSIIPLFSQTQVTLFIYLILQQLTSIVQ